MAVFNTDGDMNSSQSLRLTIQAAAQSLSDIRKKVLRKAYKELGYNNLGTGLDDDLRTLPKSPRDLGGHAELCHDPGNSTAEVGMGPTSDVSSKGEGREPVEEYRWSLIQRPVIHANTKSPGPNMEALGNLRNDSIIPPVLLTDHVQDSAYKDNILGAASTSRPQKNTRYIFFETNSFILTVLC